VWSPNGKTIAAYQIPGEQNLGTIVTIDPSDGDRKPLHVSRDAFLNGAAWLPGSKFLAVLFSNADLQFRRSQVGLISYPEGKFHAVTADTNDYSNLSVASDGQTVAAIMHQPQDDIYVSAGEKADYSDLKRVPSEGMHYRVTWTKDGKLVAENDSSVDVMSLDGKTIASLGRLTAQPRGCGDGRVVYTHGDLKTLNVTIWISEADGTGARQLSSGKNDQNPVCSFDTKLVYYIDSVTRRLMRVPIGGGTPQVVTDTLAEGDSGFDLSPDGRTLVLGTYDFKAEKPTFSIMAADSGQILKSYEYDSRHTGQVRFAPDGKAVVYPVREKGVDNLWLQPLDGGPGRQLTNFDSLKIGSYQWSPDGKYLALVRGDSPSDIVLIQDARNQN